MRPQRCFISCLRPSRPVVREETSRNLTPCGGETSLVERHDGLPGLLQEAVRRLRPVEMADPRTSDRAVELQDPAMELQALGIEPVQWLPRRNLSRAPH